MRTVFAPYNLRVSATRHLAEMFDSFCIRPEGSRFRPRADDLVVNWGRTDLPRFPLGRVLNHPDAVAVCVNKLRSFEAFREHNVPTVEWTTHVEQARAWFDNGDTVIARSSLTGRGGQGILVHLQGGAAPYRGPYLLWTKYAKRKHEYRVHVLDGRVIDVQQKRLRNGAERTPTTSIVRSYDNGWVFCREGVEAPECVLNASVAAVRSLGLDFGGADVGHNLHHNRAYVYEVNSAPGIEGTTLEKYRAAIAAL